MENFDSVLRDVGIKKYKGYAFYFREFIYSNVDFQGKTIADVGGGNGIASFYALSADPQCQCWIVDPIIEGSNLAMMDQYALMAEKTDATRVHFHKDFIETLEDPQQFDIVLMHNSINHIGEDIIEEAKSNDGRYLEFIGRLKPIIDRVVQGGTIIVSDCGTENFWDKIGLRSPFAPTIEWNLHGEPEFWQKMLESVGCAHVKTGWTSRRELGKLGKLLLANRFTSYFTTRHFVSVYKKV